MGGIRTTEIIRVGRERQTLHSCSFATFLGVRITSDLHKTYTGRELNAAHLRNSGHRVVNHVFT